MTNHLRFCLLDNNDVVFGCTCNIAKVSKSFPES